MRPRKTLVAYLSGHGFGHMTRSEAVLERVARAGVAVHVRTDDRALILARRAKWAASLTEVPTGPGVLQRGPVEVDIDATEGVLARYVASLDRLAAREAQALRELRADLVYGDVPPVAFLAAERAGIRSVALANFTWSWIYEGYAARREAFRGLSRALAQAEAKASLLLELPRCGGAEHFPRREAIPLVVRARRHDRDAARALLPVPRGEKRPVVLVSFGGFGGEFDLARAAARNPGYYFVLFSPPRERAENVGVLAHDHDLPHQDLVFGADVVLGKLGYSTVAEAIAANRAFAYTPRGDFREFPHLVALVEENLPHSRLSLEDLQEGRWSDALDAALAAPSRVPALGVDGAEQASMRVLDLLLNS